MSEVTNTSGAEFSSDMGIEFLGMVNGAVTLQLDLSQKHMSRANRVHGGVLFTLLDSALGRAILNELPMGRLIDVGANWVYLGRYRSIEDDINAVKSVTREDVQSLIEEYKPGDFTQFSVGPS